MLDGDPDYSEYRARVEKVPRFWLAYAIAAVGFATAICGWLNIKDDPDSLPIATPVVPIETVR